MFWILFFITVFVGSLYLASKDGVKPCPREDMGYKCRRGLGQKCECEE